MKALLSLVLLFACLSANASETATVLLNEFQYIRQIIESRTADGNVGGYYDFIEMDGYEILYTPEFDTDHDVIRVFLNRETPEKDFSITYYLTDHIVRGRRVLRRFVGPEPTGWRNDTIDVNTLEYLGSQGNSRLILKEDEQKIADELGVTLF